MVITQQAVRHRIFGTGRIRDLYEGNLVVAFACGEKRFVFPDAFAQFLAFEDEKAQAQVEAMLENRKNRQAGHAQALLEKARRERRAREETREELIPDDLEAYEADADGQETLSTIFDLSPFRLHASRNL